ncbi:oligohyaluronate lyase [Companilactobacillus zhachilii]|uniref:Oligohyaluronate lyase n=1 Tax=Companilactobacillus zhachilii TaxID=2304606 RepID=A0A386PP07_9LACO|nr:heparinase II/III family protein [Companilactobacillus zhachilii]AYE37256.1 oligohyaluronate lyase [Companilactobacillus zhachilii]
MSDNLSTVKNLLSNNQVAYTDLYFNNSKLLLENKFLFQHVYNMEPSPITYQLEDWHKSPNGDPEWLYVLNRQEYLQDLLITYLYTNDEKYLLKAKRFMMDWIQNDYDQIKYRYTAWRTIDTGIRLLNWSLVYKVLVKKNLLTDIEKIKIDETIQAQAEYLNQNYIDKYDLSNWGVLITTGILCFNAVNEDVISADLVSWALHKLTTEMELQVDDDGIHWEQSPLYFIEVFRSTLCVYAAYKNNGLEFPEVIIKKLRLMLKAFDYFVLPNSKILQQGDTDAIETADLIASAQLILNSKMSETKYDFIPLEFYSLNNLSLTRTQEENSSSYLDATISGNYYMKDQRGNYWHCYNGDLGSGHGHTALGHIDLTIDNQNILIDPGRYTYIDSEIRRNLKSGSSHNIVSIDDVYPLVPHDSWKYAKVTTPGNNQVKHFENYDVVVTSYFDKEHCFNYTRYFIWFKKHELALIFDVGTQKGKHLKKNNWILSPELIAEASEENGSIVLSQADNKKFKMFFSDKIKQAENQIYSPRYNEQESTVKIVTSSEFENQFVSYFAVGNDADVDTITKLQATRSGSHTDVLDTYCYPIEIALNDGTKIDVVLEHENTFIGDKVYYVNGQPYYGDLVISENGEYNRLL